MDIYKKPSDFDLLNYNHSNIYIDFNEKTKRYIILYNEAIIYKRIEDNIKYSKYEGVPSNGGFIGVKSFENREKCLAFKAFFLEFGDSEKLIKLRGHNRINKNVQFIFSQGR